MSEMRNVIKDEAKFEADIRDEQLKILEAIITLMYTPVRAQCPYSTSAETLSSLFNL